MKRYFTIIVSTVLFALIATEPVAAQKAFPTAEGFGKLATGGRGGQVVEVTNLEDDTEGAIEGSFRWALKQYSNEPVTIVFRVSGDIKLQSELKLKRADFTIAGQTAPGDGICISGNKVNFGGSSNFIMRHMRFRVGQNDASGTVVAANAFGAENCSNFIIDHCTFGWSVEENINTFDDQLHTIQWCIVHEGLYDAGHSKGVRGYGMQWGGSQATYHHNLIANNNSRSCRFNGARGSSAGQDLMVYIEYVNNVNYNWGSSGACYGAENTSENAYLSSHEVNFVNNYYKPGPATPSEHIFVNQSLARDGATSKGPSKWHFEGNVMHGDASITADNWKGFSNGTSYSLSQIKVDTIIQPKCDTLVNPKAIVKYYKYDWATYTLFNEAVESAESAFNSVLDSAGAFPRDAVDARLCNDAKNGTATYGNYGIINTERDAEGFIVHNQTTPVTDADHDGMDDAWELSKGLKADDASDRNNKTAEGYTALEVYINGLVGEIIEMPTSVETIDCSGFSLLSNVVDDELSVVSEKKLEVAHVYNTSGRKMLSASFERNNTVNLQQLPKGQYVLVAYTTEGSAKSFKFTKR